MTTVYLVRHGKDAPNLTDYTGLNLTDISVYPHWGSPFFARDMTKVMQVMYKSKQKYILLNDYQYLIIKGDQINFIDVKDI